MQNKYSYNMPGLLGDPLRSYYNQERTLPNQGGSYSVGDQMAPNTSGLNGNQFYSPPTDYPPANTSGLNGNQFYSPPTDYSSTNTGGLFTGSAGQQKTEVDLYAKYRDPKTGEVMSPDEYSIYLGSKVPQQRGAGTIPQYAGDAMTNPDQSAEELTARARGMMNERNDIATGTTDPYGAASKSGIAYSPQELQAIEKAYAGIYDPAINDVFARLKTREDEAKRKADREDRIFATNESIRQWKATTGTKSSDDGDFNFTDTDIKNGVKNSELSFDDFNKIESPEVKNFFSRPPTWKDAEGKSYPLPSILNNIVKLLESGDESMTIEDAIAFIEEQNVPQEVKEWYIQQLPAPSEQKEEASKRIWFSLGGFNVMNLFNR